MIHIRVLGRFSVAGRRSREANFQTARGHELFAYLVLESGRMFHRARLAEQFWAHLPENRARKALSTEVWRIGTALREVGVDVDAALPRTHSAIGYRRQPDHRIDVDLLDAAVAVQRSIDPEAASDAQVAVVQAGVDAYCGDLLETSYSDWCLIWRETLRDKHIACVRFLMRAAMIRQLWSAALGHAQTLLRLDPLLEDVHRAAMRCHYQAGNRPLALRQYAWCEQVLREELGVAPMDETRRVQETILAVTPAPSAAMKAAARVRDPGLPSKTQSGRSPAQKVDMALANINTARNWLEDASHDLRNPRA